MSDVIDPAAIRKLDAKPGDVLVLDLPEDYDQPDPEDLARIDTQIKAALGFEVKVLVTPPGATLETRGSVRQSIVRMSGEILAELIGLPASARIVAVSNCEPFNVNGVATVAIKIEDEGLRSVPGGCVIPDIHSRFTRGDFVVRQEWDGPQDGPGGYWQAAPPPIIRPDAEKLANLLSRVSDFLFVNGRDLSIYPEVLGAIAELRGVPATVEQPAVKPPLTWGDVEKLTQDALKWHKEYAATAAGIVKKPLAQPGEQGGYAVPREAALLAVENGVLPPDAVAAMELGSDKPSNLGICPEGHHLKNGPCRRDYCFCHCLHCEWDCAEIASEEEGQ